METTEKENRVRKYRVTVGDMDGNANALQTDDMARAEQYATSKLGRQWGLYREITIARFYEWNGTEYKLLSEMEY
jgi:hypothetical protein